MDFAAEPVLDAFTPPPRAAGRSSAPDAETGATFDEHLAAANETAPNEHAPARTESGESAEHRTDAPSAGAKPAAHVDTEASEPADATALLGPATATPPPQPIAAPVMVQIAAAQPAPAQAQGTDPSAAIAPVAATQTPSPNAPILQSEAPTQSAAPARPTNVTAAPAPAANAKGEAVAPAPASHAHAPVQTAQAALDATAQARPAVSPAAQSAAMPSPPAVQQAIAVTMAPALQLNTDPAQSFAKAATGTIEGKVATETRNARQAPAPAQNNARPQVGKAVAVPSAPSEIAQAAAQGSSDAAEIAQAPAATTTQTQASAHTQHVAADTGAQRAAPAAAQVAREIVRRFEGGNTSFEFRLDPPELGRVEVRMEVSRDHRVTAVIAADSPQALTELARHARELEAQLQSAGLQLSDNGLSFDLRQGAGGGEADEAQGARASGGGEALTEEQPAPAARPIGFERWRGVRVDMMV